MASIQAGPPRKGRRAVDAEVALIPFIDLLLCCVMFLLVTAVWNELASVQTTQRGPDDTADVVRPSTDPLTLRVLVDRYVLSSEVGDRIEIAADGSAPAIAELASLLEDRRRLRPGERRILVSAEDGVRYERVVAVMDTAVGTGFADVSLSASPL